MTFRGAARWTRTAWPELISAAMAALIFLGMLGAVDLWGKREQRAAAEALDTVQHNHWLIAEIQARPRLEKPPLPRWMTAVLMSAAGQPSEWVVRLPSALSAIGAVGLVYWLGRGLGGRSVGLASALALMTTGYAITEHRQAGNDGPLAFFTTLALFAAWKRLERDDAPKSWSILMWAALGLGFLTKGPVILALVAVTVVPYLFVTKRLKPGLRALVGGWGIPLFVVLALSWPVPVLLVEREALGVWMLEIGQKVGSAGVAHHGSHPPLALEWFWMAMPWTPFALMGLVLPFAKSCRELKPAVWFPWFWAFGNLAMFSCWSVAKPNYYVPCLPGVALLVGFSWTRAAEVARRRSGFGFHLLRGLWVMLLVVGVAAPVAIAQELPRFQVPALISGALLAGGTIGSFAAWRRGAVAMAIAPIALAFAIGVPTVYAAIARPYFGAQSYEALATRLDDLLPPEERTLMFYFELDEGLWFYLKDRRLAPVPRTQPEFNAGYDMLKEAREQRLVRDRRARLLNELALLESWIDDPSREARFMLIRDKFFDRFAPELGDRVVERYRERGLARSQMILLELPPPPAAGGLAHGEQADSEATTQR